MGREQQPGLAGLIGAAIGGAAVGGISLGVILAIGTGDLTMAGSVTFWAAISLLPIILIVAPALGLPCYWLLQRSRTTTFWVYMLVGALAGAVVAVPIAEWLSTWSYMYSIIGALSGASTALFFWLIRRPDRDANSAVIPADRRESRDPGVS